MSGLTGYRGGVTVHVIHPQIGLLRPLTEEGLVGPELAPRKYFLASFFVWRGLLAPLTLVFSHWSSSHYLLPPLQASGNPSRQ